MPTLFPSPYWGLFFYPQEVEIKYALSKFVEVSVPVLGINFLSIRKIN